MALNDTKTAQKNDYIRRKLSPPMAKITLLLNTRYATKDKTYPLVIRVNHQGQRRMIPVGHSIPEKYWTGTELNKKHPDYRFILAAIDDKMSEIRRYLVDCQLNDKPVNMDMLASGQLSQSFTDYLRHRAAQYKDAKKIIMDRKVRRWATELEMAGGGNVYFDHLTPDFLRRLDQQMIDAGNVENTRNKKFKFLERFYNHAIREGLCKPPNPFAAHKIVVKPVKKDKLTQEQIAALERLELATGPLNDARNLFLFSYYTKGQRFEVCVTLTREKIQDGRIYFKTNKGNEFLSVLIHQRLRAILDQYSHLPGPLVFPYLKEIPAEKEKYINQVGSKNALVNLSLKVIGAMIGAPWLKFHDARHSFAYQLKQVTNNINIIQDALAHSSQATTKVYLKALEDDVLDKEMEKLYGK